VRLPAAPPGLAGVAACMHQGVALLAALAAAVVLTACSPPPPSTPKASAAPNIAATAPGKYKQGDRVVLANGVRLAVPTGGRVTLNTTGSLVATAPGETGVIGGMVSPTSLLRGWLMLSVYGPKAGFAEELARMERNYAERASNKSAPFSMTRVSARPTSETTVTSFVTLYQEAKPRREIIIYVQRVGALPLIIWGDGMLGVSEPDSTHDKELPKRLLDYLKIQFP